MYFTRRHFLRAGACSLISSQFSPAFSEENGEIIVRLTKHNYDEYQVMLNGRKAVDVDDFNEFKNFNRQMMETWLFQKAVHVGDFPYEVKLGHYSIMTNYARTIANINGGFELAHPIAAFKSESLFSKYKNLLVSTPILNGNDFFVGLYTHEDRKDVLSVKTEEEVKKLKFICVRSWAIDLKVLNAYEFDRITSDDWKTLISLIKIGRADVIMQPFRPADDMGFRDFESSLYMVPIPGLKLRFGAGRSYLASQTHPLGQSFIEALNRGIKTLDQDDLLKKLHVAAAVTDPRTDNFKILFPNVNLQQI